MIKGSLHENVKSHDVHIKNLMNCENSNVEISQPDNTNCTARVLDTNQLVNEKQVVNDEDSSKINHLQYDGISLIEDSNGLHVLIDQVNNIKSIDDLTQYEKATPQGFDGVLLHIKRKVIKNTKVDDRQIISCVAVSFHKSIFDIISATQTLAAYLPDWLSRLAILERTPIDINTNTDLTTNTDISTNDDIKSERCDTKEKSEDQPDETPTTNEDENKPHNRPTLFNLLEALANNTVTSADQRNCIRGIVTDFLNNELQYGKVYAYIGAVIGHDVLHSIIRSLENNPDRLPLPDAEGLNRIETSFGLSRHTSQNQNKGKKEIITQDPVDGIDALTVIQSRTKSNNNFQDQNKMDPQFYSKEDIIRAIRHNLEIKKILPSQSTKEAAFDKVRWIPLNKRLSPGNIYGHSVINVGNKSFFFGGTNIKGYRSSFR